VEHLSPGAGPSRRGHRIIPLDLPGQANERGGVLQRDGRLARFEALVAAPERKASQVGCAGYGEPSLGAGRRDDTYPPGLCGPKHYRRGPHQQKHADRAHNPAVHLMPVMGNSL
jgi:hypothetical protein